MPRGDYPEVIREAHGNLLAADAHALVNTVNTVGVMGKGIALQFKQAYPDNFRAYEAACRRGEVQVGRMFVWQSGQLGSPRFIVNFPTKRHWRESSRIEDIRDGLRDLAKFIGDRGVTSIAIPALGCGNGGLRREDVRPLIVAALEDLDADILLYPPSS
jgi:O-acetyl-ADP-ribose deacetylase (regulator of RNase III)